MNLVPSDCYSHYYLKSITCGWVSSVHNLQEYLAVCDFCLYLVVTKLHAIFFTYMKFFKWKPEIRVQSCVWSTPPIQNGGNVAECNRMKLGLTVIDDFSIKHIQKVFISIYYSSQLWANVLHYITMIVIFCFCCSNCWQCCTCGLLIFM